MAATHYKVPNDLSKDTSQAFGSCHFLLPRKVSKPVKKPGKLKGSQCAQPQGHPHPNPVISTQASPELRASVWSRLLGILPKQDLQDPHQGRGATAGATALGPEKAIQTYRTQNIWPSAHALQGLGLI